MSIPEKMKTVRIETYGSPEVMNIIETDVPKPRPGEVLIKVWAMADIFDHRCALVNKNGVCHQCSELNGWFNPKENQQQTLVALDLVKGCRKYNRHELYRIRATLVKAIDPLRSEGADLEEMLMKCNRMVMREIEE